MQRTDDPRFKKLLQANNGTKISDYLTAQQREVVRAEQEREEKESKDIK